VLANPAQRYVAAFANAVGTTVGVAVLMYLLAQNEGYIKDSFPSVFNHPTWGKTYYAVEAYGWLGALIISVQPVFLQPLVAVCTMADMNRAVLIASVLAGRTLKCVKPRPSVLIYSGSGCMHDCSFFVVVSLF
jgi:hypothetical protein